MRPLLGATVFFAIGEGRHIPGSERRIFTDGSVTGDGKTGWLVMGYDRIERDGNNPGEQLRDLYSSVGLLRYVLALLSLTSFWPLPASR
jgi:hypothetical protein